MTENPTLEWYREKDQPRYEFLGWRGLLFRARTKSLEVNSRAYSWKTSGSKL